MITTNISEVMGKMRARSPAVLSQLRAAAATMAPQLKAESVRIMNEEIYAIPEKRSRTGRRLWTRTGQLRAAEDAEPGGKNGVDVEMKNAMPYAGARYHLGDPVKPAKAASGQARQVRPPQRSVQWQKKAAEQKRPYVLETRRRAVLRGLRAAR